MLEHARVGDRALDVLLEESVVEGDRFCELLHTGIGPRNESTTPGLTGHSDSPDCNVGCCITLWHTLTQSRQWERVLSISGGASPRSETMGYLEIDQVRQDGRA